MDVSKHSQQFRRIALLNQGLLSTKPFGRGTSGALAAIKHIGYVQADSISVIERAHHHVLHSRVPGYKPAILNKLLVRGDIFEYWAHAAAFLPIEDYKFSLPYKTAIKNGQVHWFKDPDQKLMSELLSRIKIDGPLRSRDIESSKNANTGWWDWKPTKKALEQLYMQGDLMVCDREGFEKTYDLTERVLPTGVDTKPPSIEEFAQHLIEQQLRCHGLISLKGITYQRRNKALREAVKDQIELMLKNCELITVSLGEKEDFMVKPELMEAGMPRVTKRVSLLSPFDNAVIQRERLKSLFAFDYQLECYVPPQKRQYGYFSLPILFGDDFVGRVDCKNHRDRKHLVINALYLDEAFFAKKGSSFESFIEAFVQSIKRFSEFQQCTSIELNLVSPAKFAQPLHNALVSVE